MTFSTKPYNLIDFCIVRMMALDITRIKMFFTQRASIGLYKFSRGNSIIDFLLSFGFIGYSILEKQFISVTIVIFSVLFFEIFRILVYPILDPFLRISLVIGFSFFFVFVRHSLNIAFFRRIRQ